MDYSPKDVVAKFVSYARHFHRRGDLALMKHNMGLARAAKAAAVKLKSY